MKVVINCPVRRDELAPVISTVRALLEPFDLPADAVCDIYPTMLGNESFIVARIHWDDYMNGEKVEHGCADVGTTITEAVTNAARLASRLWKTGSLEEIQK